MLSRTFLAVLSKNISVAKTGSEESDKPFGGINVILCGDFHQFPPVASRKRAPLYYESNVALGDTIDECLGREIYEAFDKVVILAGARF